MAEVINPLNREEAWSGGDVYTIQSVILNGYIVSESLIYFPIFTGKLIPYNGVTPSFTTLKGSIYGVTGCINNSGAERIDFMTAPYMCRLNHNVDKANGNGYAYGILVCGEGQWMGADESPVPINTPVSCMFTVLQITFK